MGITIPKKAFKKLPKKFTGLEIRPMIKNNNYGKGSFGKMQQDLLIGAKGSRRKTARRLSAQQRALIKDARGGRKKHKKRIQRESAKELKRIKLYRSRKAHRKALKTKKLKKRKQKRKQIINRINDVFR